ncbi:hypothetical protein GHT06_014107 [Daphnia sinensis]|uniref:Uncharacterized protein n=1 Tax=Daphnia sinensis TaxID=1820382 RepID=A0AAD5KT94_9CRUS|nr:hypothetical protein GHT06_014107 [Daphnia sinensis]
MTSAAVVCGCLCVYEASSWSALVDRYDDGRFAQKMRERSPSNFMNETRWEEEEGGSGVGRKEREQKKEEEKDAHGAYRERRQSLYIGEYILNRSSVMKSLTSDPMDEPVAAAPTYAQLVLMERWLVVIFYTGFDQCVYVCVMYLPERVRKIRHRQARQRTRVWCLPPSLTFLNFPYHPLPRPEVGGFDRTSMFNRKFLRFRRW